MLHRNLLIAIVGWAASVCSIGAAAKEEGSFELAPAHCISYGGEVTESAKAKDSGVEFTLIPVRGLGVKTWYNPVSRAVEQTITPPVNHPVPVQRAAHVRAFAEKPDLANLALDQVGQFENEVQLQSDKPFVLIADGNGIVRLITLSKITIPQDKPDDWRLIGTMHRVTLPEHIDDSIADRGRAMPTKEPLPLKGRLIFATRKDLYSAMQWNAVDLPDGKMKKIADATEARLSVDGTMVDRTDARTLRVTDKRGALVGEVRLEGSDIAEFNISPDAKRIVLSTERFVDVPNGAPHREIASIVYSADGKRMGEVIGYDDAAFLPDGNLIMTGAGGDPSLYIGNVKTGETTLLEIKEGPAGDSKPDWPRTPAVSPDGKWIAYATRRKVCVVGIDGRGWTPVWEVPGDQPPQKSPVFSPDGKYIAMIVVPLNVMSGPGEVTVFDLKKHVRQPIESAKDADSELPLVWHPAE